MDRPDSAFGVAFKMNPGLRRDDDERGTRSCHAA
jgi:hypothetical protein